MAGLSQAEAGRHGPLVEGWGTSGKHARCNMGHRCFIPGPVPLFRAPGADPARSGECGASDGEDPLVRVAWEQSPTGRFAQPLRHNAGWWPS
jgi:hypothetical protein